MTTADAKERSAAKTVATGSASAKRLKRPDQGQWRPSITRLVLPSAAVLIFAGVHVVYLHTFALSTALDSTSAEYRQHWYPVIALDMLAFGAVMLAVRRLAGSACAVCTESKVRTGSVSARHELDHFWTFIGVILAGTLSICGLQGFVGLHDFGWHTSTLRDTVLAPTHITFFFGMGPLVIALLVWSFVYARTRLPDQWGKAKGIPLAYMVAAGAWGVTMLFFGLNEFGHTQWIAEERLANPFHYAFLVPFLGQLPMLSLVLDAVPRLQHLISVIQSEPNGLRASGER